jgi:citrate synthase
VKLFRRDSWLLLKGDLPTRRQLADFHQQLAAPRDQIQTEVIKNFPKAAIK